MLQQLPEEALANVLMRLSSRTLLSFKFVCKEWRSLINEPWFRDQQQQYARQHSNYVDNILIVSHAPNRGRSVQLIDWDYHKVCTTNSSQQPKFTRQQSYRKVSETKSIRPLRKFSLLSCDVLIGSCKGLTCFLINSVIVVQNLSTGLCWEFPTTYNRQCGYIGFGYVSSIDDYKIVRLGRRNVEILTLKTLSRRWRNTYMAISLLRCAVMTRKQNFLFNETLHWLYSDGSGSNICSFSLEEERFRVLPAVKTSSYSGKMALGVLAGCLCIVDLAVLYPTSAFDVWAMKEYGVAESWTKLVSVEFPDELAGAYPLNPLGIVNNDEIVVARTSLDFSTSGELLVWSVRDKSFRSFKLTHSLGEKIWCAIHTETDLELESPMMQPSTALMPRLIKST